MGVEGAGIEHACVLLVGPADESAALTAKLLAGEGWQVTRADGLDQARHRLAEVAYEAVVLDGSLLIPGPGPEAVAPLAQVCPAGGDGASIIVITDDDQLGLAAIECGADDCVAEYDSRLVEAVRHSLARRRRRPTEALWDALAAASDGVVMVDKDLRVRRFTGAAERIYGRSAREVLGSSVASLAPEHLREEQREVLEDVLAGGVRHDLETSRIQPDGSIVTLAISLAPLSDGLGGVVGACAFVRDVTDLVAARERLAKERAALTASQAAGGVGSWELDLATLVTEWSAENAVLHGLPPIALALSIDEMVAFIDPDDHAEVWKAVRGRRDFTDEYRVPMADGGHRILVNEGRWVSGGPDHPGYLVGTTRDVTGERRTRRAHEVADAQFRRAFETSTVAMAIADARFAFHRVNDAFCAFFGRRRDELVGNDIAVVARREDVEGDRMVRALVASGESFVGQRCYELPGGEEKWGELTVSAVPLPDGTQDYLLQVRDITAVRRRERALRKLADQDPLTSLLNRRAFDRELHSHLHGSGAVLMLDLDGFKAYNDALGHAAGDALLVRIADALRGALRVEDVVARFGGDEFIALLPGAGPDYVAGVAERVLATVRDATAAVTPASLPAVTASVGAALLDPAGGVLLRADEALYEAKRLGRNRWALKL